MQPRKKLARRLAAVGGALVVGTAGLVALSGAQAGAAVTTVHFASYVAANHTWSTLDQSQDVSLVADAPVSGGNVQQGATYTMTIAGGTQVIPNNNGGTTVVQAGNNAIMYPIPAGVTVGTITPGTYTFTPVGGSPTTAAKSASVCTTYGGALGSGCSASNTGTVGTQGAFLGKTGSPYLSIGTGSAVFPAGGTLTQSATVIHFTDNGPNPIVQTVSEFQTAAIVDLTGTCTANADGTTTCPSGFTGTTPVPVKAYPTATAISPPIPSTATNSPAPINDSAQGGQSVATLGVTAPPTAPVLQPQSASVSAGQCVTINVLAGATETSDTPNPASVTVTTAATAGTATANANGTVTYCNTAGGTAATDSFAVTAAGTTSGLVSAAATSTVAISYNQCSAGSGTPGTALPPLGTCSLHQEVMLPVLPGQIVLSQASGLPIDLLGSQICNQVKIPGITLNGNAQLACGALSPLTVTNSTGLDTGWQLTAQTTDFTDPGRAATTCDTVATFNNHCIPGGNLKWIPVAAVAHTVVPGDTAQVAAGIPNVVLYNPTAPPTPSTSPAASTNPIFQGSAVQANPVVELAPLAGLHDAPLTLCSTASGQAGGTFVCAAGLTLDIPASIAEPGPTATGLTAPNPTVLPGYVATVTLTLS